MGCVEELKSAQFNIYAQWLGLALTLIMLITGIYYLFSFVFWSGIVVLFFAFIVIMMEIPFCRRCCPSSPRLDSIIEKSENHVFRAAFYILMSVVLWLFLLIVNASTIPGVVLVALIMDLTAICYLIAMCKGEQRKNTAIAGGTSV